MNCKVLEEIRNDEGELITKVVRLTNKKAKEGIHFDSINDLYKELLEKYNSSDITIIGKPMDGNFLTLKSRTYSGSDLKHCDESYFSNLPAKAKEKVRGVYYSVDITIQC